MGSYVALSGGFKVYFSFLLPGITLKWWLNLVEDFVQLRKSKKILLCSKGPSWLVNYQKVDRVLSRLGLGRIHLTVLINNNNNNILGFLLVIDYLLHIEKTLFQTQVTESKDPNILDLKRIWNKNINMASLCFYHLVYCLSYAWGVGPNLMLLHVPRSSTSQRMFDTHSHSYARHVVLELLKSPAFSHTSLQDILK